MCRMRMHTAWVHMRMHAHGVHTEIRVAIYGTHVHRFDHRRQVIPEGGAKRVEAWAAAVAAAKAATPPVSK